MIFWFWFFAVATFFSCADFRAQAESANGEYASAQDATASTVTLLKLQVQRDTLDYVALQARLSLSRPTFPDDAVVAWVLERRKTFSGKSEQVYRAVGEELLVAQQLLSSKNLQRRRQGLRLLRHTDLFVQQKLPDEKLLRARLYEGFVLPYIESAHWPSWQDLSRQRLAERAIAAFSQAGERDNEIRTLYLLFRFFPNENTRDWAFGRLAQAYAARNEYAKAANYLRRIQSNMRIKNLIPEYEAKARELQNATKKKQP